MLTCITMDISENIIKICSMYSKSTRIVEHLLCPRSGTWCCQKLFQISSSFYERIAMKLKHLIIKIILIIILSQKVLRDHIMKK